MIFFEWRNVFIHLLSPFWWAVWIVYKDHLQLCWDPCSYLCPASSPSYFYSVLWYTHRRKDIVYHSPWTGSTTTCFPYFNLIPCISWWASHHLTYFILFVYLFIVRFLFLTCTKEEILQGPSAENCANDHTFKSKWWISKRSNCHSKLHTLQNNPQRIPLRGKNYSFTNT